MGGIPYIGHIHYAHMYTKLSTKTATLAHPPASKPHRASKATVPLEISASEAEFALTLTLALPTYVHVPRKSLAVPSRVYRHY
jgi:hypothetical protein